MKIEKLKNTEIPLRNTEIVFNNNKISQKEKLRLILN